MSRTRSEFLKIVAFATLLVMPIASSAQGQQNLPSSVDAASVPKDKRTAAALYMTSKDAAAAAADKGILLIDTRSRAEATFVGFPTTAARNIPYMHMDGDYAFDAKKGEYKLTLNPDFATAVANLVKERGLDKSAPILLMCRSGTRSAKAADLLGKLGYIRVYSVVDGFEGDKDGSGQRTVNGWKNNKLPWSYKIGEQQAYKSPSF